MSTGFPPSVRDIVNRRAQGQCEICGEFTQAAEIHHRRPRGMGGTKRDSTNSASGALWLCRTCHRFIESNRRLALLLGWIVGSLSDPAETPVVYRGVRVRLSDDGTLEAA